jgi:hypothetical protein
MLSFKRHLEEKLKASDDMGDWVKDFQDSDAPQFKGKSQKKRQQMAVAAKLGAERNEEVELDEKYKDPWKAPRKGSSAWNAAQQRKKADRDPEEVKRVNAIGNKNHMVGTAKVTRNEEVELDEVSDKKLDAYRQKAFADQPSGDDGSDKYRKRKFGRDLAFSKQTGRAKVLATKESVEELDELKKSTLGSYIKRAAGERGHAGIEAGASSSGSKDQKDAMSTMKKRLKGIKMASDRLAKESVEELDELKKSTLGSYVRKASVDAYRRGQDTEYHTAARDATDNYGAKRRHAELTDKARAKASNRITGIEKATRKLAKEEVELDQETQYEIVESYLLENNIDVNSLTEEELNELIGKAIGGAFKLGAKAVVGAGRLARKAVVNKQGNVRGTQAAKNDAMKAKLDKLRKQRTIEVQRQKLKKDVERAQAKLTATKSRA